MSCYCQCMENFRYCFSLRVGLSCLSFIYLVSMVYNLMISSVPPVLQIAEGYFGINVMSMSTLYYAAGITVITIAWIGIMLSEKKFIVPLIAYDGTIFIMYIFSILYIIYNSSDKFALKVFMMLTVVRYFALTLEYNFYRQLVKKGVHSSNGRVQSLIILPAETGNDINSRAILQQYKESLASAKYQSRHHPAESIHQPQPYRQSDGPSSQRPISYSVPFVYFSMNSETEAPPPYSP